MTTIVAKKVNGEMWMASDTRTNGGFRGLYDNGNHKIFKIKKDIMLGISGYANSKVLFDEINKDEDLLSKFDLYTEFGLISYVREFYKWVDDYYFFEKEENGSAHYQFLFCVKDKIYSIDRCLTISEELDYGAIGSGREFAYGALYNGLSPIDAIETAMNFDNCTGGEITTLEYKI